MELIFILYLYLPYLICLIFIFVFTCYIELSSPKIRKFVIFFPKKTCSEKVFYFLRKSFSNFQETKLFLYFRKGNSEPWHNGTFLIFEEGYIQKLGIT